MRLVLWPNHLLGGILTRSGGPVAAAERGEGGLAGGVRNMLGRWPDADVVLQQGMSEGLRDWDLWYAASIRCVICGCTNIYFRGPLLFCLLLSLFLSFRAPPDQKSLVFSGVFALVWIGEAAVTFQIRLLGGNMYAVLYH